MERIVRPRAASSTTSTTAVAAVRRSLPSTPPLRATGGGGAADRRSSVRCSCVNTASIGADADENSLKRSSRSHAPRHNGHGMRVLVVEDEKKLGELLGRGLREEG